MSTQHQLINPETMAPAKGFAHAVVPSDGRAVYLAGQTASDITGAIVGDTFDQQYDLALWNVVEALKAAGGEPTDIVSLVVYTTTMSEYRNGLHEVGAAHRKHLGKHFPAMAMLGVTELFDPAATVEIIATAVIPATIRP
ncbi:MAG: RidA family protein [Acidimicrobiales bacterium]